MMLVRCYLAPSAIDGLGVFSHQDIKRGQNVWRRENLLDVRLARADMALLDPQMRDFVERHAYPDFSDPSYLILECDEGRFMNHVEDPNLDFSDGALGYARRDIPAGTELTCHYSSFTPVQADVHPPRPRAREYVR